MSQNHLHEVTQLLQRWSKGDTSINDQLFDLIHKDLRQYAQQILNGHSSRPFQATELVHDAYIRLVRNPPKELKSREHFFNLTIRVMRHILIDFAKSQKAQKRGSGQPMVTLKTVDLAETSQTDIVALSDGLEALREEDARKADVVYARFFWGYSNEEVAEYLNVSEPTVKRDWRQARAYLYDYLHQRKNSI